MDRTDEDRAAKPLRSMYGLSGFTWPEFIATFGTVIVLAAVILLWLA
jgi:hypothetical protein